MPVVFLRMPVANPANDVPLILTTVAATAPEPDAVTSPVSEVIVPPVEATLVAHAAAVVKEVSTHTNSTRSPVDIVLMVLLPEDTTVTNPLDELATHIDQPAYKVDSTGSLMVCVVLPVTI